MDLGPEKDARLRPFSQCRENPYAIDDSAATLKRLATKVDESAGNMAFLAVITAPGHAYRRSDGVYVIPVSRLAP